MARDCVRDANGVGGNFSKLAPRNPAAVTGFRGVNRGHGFMTTMALPRRSTRGIRAGGGNRNCCGRLRTPLPSACWERGAADAQMGPRRPRDNPRQICCWRSHDNSERGLMATCGDCRPTSSRARLIISNGVLRSQRFVWTRTATTANLYRAVHADPVTMRCRKS